MELTQMNIFMVTSAIGFISSACFAVGFGILIMNTLNQVRNSESSLLIPKNVSAQVFA